MEALSAYRSATQPSCILCGGACRDLWGPVGRGPHFVVFCPACRVGRTWPPPTAAEQADLHALGRFRAPGGERFRPWVEWAVDAFRIARSRRVAGGRPSGRALDVGCGRGLFLDHLRRRGWRVAGAELDEATASSARVARGIEVVWGAPGGWGLEDGSYDAVTFFHSLEHAGDPVALLRRCGELLRPGGLLVVAVPNLGSWQARFGRERWFHLDVPRHATHFTAAGLLALLDRLGYQPLALKRFSVEHGPFGWLQTLLNRLGLERNALFRWLRGGTDEQGRPPGAWAVAGSLALLPLLGSLAVALALAEALGPGGGGAVEVWAAKRTLMAVSPEGRP